MTSRLGILRYVLVSVALYATSVAGQTVAPVAGETAAAGLLASPSAGAPIPTRALAPDDDTRPALQ